MLSDRGSHSRSGRGLMLRCFFAIFGCLVFAGNALAQRTDENAVTAAPDAFGTSIGFQSVGLYSPNDARGFSPQQAGNLRIEGLYFDQQTFATTDCMVRETTMRVGIAAQTYAFPAPTGIADLSLRTPGEHALISSVATWGPFDASSIDAEAQLPLVDRKLSVDLCATYRLNSDANLFHEARDSDVAATFRWQPTASIEIIPFWSQSWGGARRIVPGVYTDGTLRVPQFRAQDIASPDWTQWGWHENTYGVVTKASDFGPWQLSAGVFHSLENDPSSDQPYVTLISNSLVDSVLDTAPPVRDESTSGEIRLTGVWGSGADRHSVQFAVRGRTSRDNSAATSLPTLARLPLIGSDAIAQPPDPFTRQSRDSTRQLDVG